MEENTEIPYFVKRLILMRMRSKFLYKPRKGIISNSKSNPRTWSQCRRNFKFKMRRLNNLKEPETLEDIEKKLFKSLWAFQNAKLKRLYGYFEYWSVVQFRIMEKIKHQKFPQEKGSLWVYVFKQQRRKLKNRKWIEPKPIERRWRSIQRTKLFHIRKAKPISQSDHDWSYVFGSSAHEVKIE